MEREKMADERQHFDLGADLAVHHIPPDGLISASECQLTGMGFRKRFQPRDPSDKGSGFDYHDARMIQERFEEGKILRRFLIDTQAGDRCNLSRE
jgi:hypothetical protein